MSELCFKLKQVENEMKSAPLKSTTVGSDPMKLQSALNKWLSEIESRLDNIQKEHQTQVNDLESILRCDLKEIDKKFTNSLNESIDKLSDLVKGLGKNVKKLSITKGKKVDETYRSEPFLINMDNEDIYS